MNSVSLCCEECGARAQVPQLVPVPGLLVLDGSAALVGIKPAIQCAGTPSEPHPPKQMAIVR